MPADRPEEILLGHQLRGAHVGGCRDDLDLVLRAAGRTATGASTRWARRRRIGSTPSRTASWSSPTTTPAAGRSAGGALGAELCEDAFVDSDRRHAGDRRGPRFRQRGRRLHGLRIDRRRRDVRADALHRRARRPHHRPRDRRLLSDDDRISRSPQGTAAAPTLARSSDGGATWQLADLTAALGAGQVRIVAIDPTDADRVWLRALGADGDALALATDGGATVAVPLSFDSGGLTAFVAHLRGHAAGRRDHRGRAGAVPVDRRRRDFTALANPPHILALAERAGTVYAATDTTLRAVRRGDLDRRRDDLATRAWRSPTWRRSPPV